MMKLPTWTIGTLAAVALGGSGCARPAPSSPPTPAEASAPAAPVAAGPGRVLEGRFLAGSLGVEKRYRAWLPGGYDADPARRWPVVYMLHGLGGDEDNWLEGGKLDVAADAIGLSAIVVMPDGDTSFYVNRATPYVPAACRRGPRPFTREPAETHCVQEARYEDYITRDLIGHVDATYRTLAERRGRAIGGLSMGGFGALMLAMRHPDLYASAASHSGIDALLYAGPYPYAPGKVELVADVARWADGLEPLGSFARGIFGPDLAGWQAHDPAYLAGKLEPGALALYVDAGSEDRLGLQHGAQHLHAVLQARGIEHAWYYGPGDHDFAFWSQRIDDSLAFHARVFAQQP